MSEKRAYRETRECVQRCAHAIAPPSFPSSSTSAITIILGLVFGRAAFEKSGGIYTGVMNNLGDLPLHMQVIASFAKAITFRRRTPRSRARALPILSYAIC